MSLLWYNSKQVSQLTLLEHSEIQCPNPDTVLVCLHEFFVAFFCYKREISTDVKLLCMCVTHKKDTLHMSTA